MRHVVLKYLRFAAGCLVIAIAALIGVSYFFPPTYVADTPLPGTKSIVEVQLQPMHLYLAQYRRALVLRSPGVPDVRRHMFPDTGGHLRTQLYRLDDGRFVVEGTFDAFLVDPVKHSISQAGAKLIDSARYLGAFDDAGNGRWRFIPAPESPKQWLRIAKPSNQLRAGLGTTFIPHCCRIN